MKVTLTQNSCVVEKESGDPHFSNGGYANAESTFLYHVKQELIKQGFDVIKKRMWKDGHMMDDMQQYLRTGKIRKGQPYMMIWNGHSGS